MIRLKSLKAKINLFYLSKTQQMNITYGLNED